MKRTLMMLALAAAPACAIACGGSDEEETTDGGDGDGDGHDHDECSSEELEVPAGGAGGSGGAPSLSCETPEAPATEIEIVGEYTDQFDGAVNISATEIDLGYAVFTLSLVDNEENYAVARNAEANEYNPCAWSTFVWTESEGDLYYCQSVFSETSECGAEEADLPDTEDLDAGCGGFEWSQLTEN